MKLKNTLTKLAFIAAISNQAQAQVSRLGPLRINPNIRTEIHPSILAGIAHGMTRDEAYAALNPIIAIPEKDRTDKQKQKLAALEKYLDKLNGEGWELPTKDDELLWTQNLMGSQVVKIQGKEFHEINAHGFVSVKFPSDFEKTGRAFLPCRISKGLLDYLNQMHFRGVKINAGLTYEAPSFVGGPHQEPYYIPVNDTTVLGCIDTAADITSVNGKTVEYNNPEMARDAILDLINNLPAGEYDLGLPRERYPNGKSDSYSSASADVKNYFVKPAWGAPFYSLIGKDASGNNLYEFNEDVAKPFDLFMPWYYNTTSPDVTHLTQSKHKLFEELNEKFGPASSADRTTRENEYRDAFASGHISEIARTFIRHRVYAEQIANAIELAHRRGAKIIGIYGDALDHLHLRVRKIAQKNMFGGEPSSGLTFEANVNYAGSDYRSFELARPDYELCEKSCDSDARCVAYTFVPPRLSGKTHAVCWLKDTLNAPTRYEGVTSGVRKKVSNTSMTVEYNTNRIGGDIAMETTSDYLECARKCEANSVCDSYTFVPVLNQCFQKGEFAQAIYGLGMTSGMKTRFEDL